MSLFSVAAGVLLIILIFSMLAAERRPEMGMARALGAQRRQLIEQFLVEGAAYALLSGLIGAALGVILSTGILSHVPVHGRRRLRDRTTRAPAEPDRFL
jgi:ABC-type antimicrobial peptide transport system permease subunit